MFLGFLAPGLFLVLLVAVIAVIVAASRRQGDDEEEGPGIGTLKRVFYYFLGFVALGVAAAGLSLLMSTLLGPLFVDKLIVDSGSRLALALALTVVATPIWMYLWARSQHAVVEYPAEARSLGRQFYLHLILGITAAVAAGSVVSILQWSFGINEDPSLAMSVLLIMAGIWFFHWRAARGGGLPNKGISVLMSRLYIYVTALYALVMLAAGTGIVLYRSLLEAYEGVLHTPLLGLDTVQFWSRGMRESLSFALVGGVWWSAHWLLMARGNQQSGLRQVYLYLFAVFGGALTVVVSTALLLHGTLQWLVGAPGLDAPAEHFRFLPSVIAGLVIGSWLWGYHHAVIKEESTGNEGRFVAARRGYQYLLSAVGLGTLAVGLVIAFGVAIGLLLPGLPTLVPTADWKRLITLAVTLISVGTPLWGYVWGRVQKEATAAPVKERGSTSRRIFIYAVFGIALLITLGNLSALFFVLLRDLLEGKLALESFHESRWFTASLLMAGAISVYYGFVLREDRRLMALDAPAQPALQGSILKKRVIAMSGPEAREAVTRLEAALGYPVTWWRTLDAAAGAPVLLEAELPALAERIAQAPGTRIVLVLDAGGVKVLPYQPE